jgi:preprotein translocase subunit Sec61beta
MSRGTRKQKKKKEGPMPSASAGLIRFYQEDAPGIKIGPGAVILLVVIFIIAVTIAQLSQQGILPFG